MFTELNTGLDLKNFPENSISDKLQMPREGGADDIFEDARNAAADLDREYCDNSLAKFTKTLRKSLKTSAQQIKQEAEHSAESARALLDAEAALTAVKEQLEQLTPKSREGAASSCPPENSATEIKDPALKLLFEQFALFSRNINKFEQPFIELQKEEWQALNLQTAEDIASQARSCLNTATQQFNETLARQLNHVKLALKPFLSGQAELHSYSPGKAKAKDSSDTPTSSRSGATDDSATADDAASQSISVAKILEEHISQTRTFITNMTSDWKTQALSAMGAQQGAEESQPAFLARIGREFATVLLDFRKQFGNLIIEKVCKGPLPQEFLDAALEELVEISSADEHLLLPAKHIRLELYTKLGKTKMANGQLYGEASADETARNAAEQLARLSEFGSQANAQDPKLEKVAHIRRQEGALWQQYAKAIAHPLQRLPIALEILHLLSYIDDPKLWITPCSPAELSINDLICSHELRRAFSNKIYGSSYNPIEWLETLKLDTQFNLTEIQLVITQWQLISKAYHKGSVTIDENTFQRSLNCFKMLHDENIDSTQEIDQLIAEKAAFYYLQLLHNILTVSKNLAVKEEGVFYLGTQKAKIPYDVIRPRLAFIFSLTQAPPASNMAERYCVRDAINELTLTCLTALIQKQRAGDTDNCDKIKADRATIQSGKTPVMETQSHSKDQSFSLTI